MPRGLVDATFVTPDGKRVGEAILKAFHAFNGENAVFAAHEKKRPPEGDPYYF
jgi:hypothetical protein